MKYFTAAASIVLCSALLLSCASMHKTQEQRKGEVLYKLGVSYFDDNEIQKAFVKFQEAVRENPRDKRSYNYLGYISTRRKEYDNAVSYYKKAISIDPNYSEAMNNLGVTYLEIKNWEEAVRYFRMALKNPLYETPEKAYGNLGNALYKSGRYEEAEQTLQEALIKHPQYYYSAYLLGLIYTDHGRIDDAIEMFNTAVDIAPYDLEPRWELANAYLRVGEDKKAYEHFKIISEIGSSPRKEEAVKYLDLLDTP